jgi:hypothetical protein
MERGRAIGSAVCLVASPLLVLAYWLTYPAYGELHGDDVLRAVDHDPSRTALADVFGLLGALLAVTASLVLMRVLARSAPRLAWLGGCLSVVGWISVTALLMTDVLAVEIAHRGPTRELVRLFEDVLANPVVIALNAAAALHVVGGVLLGIALVYSRLVPRWLAVAAMLAPAVHLAANVAGQLWLDSITWVVVAAAYAYLVPTVLGGEVSDLQTQGAGRGTVRR